ncbi:MAG: tetratricopeptide repeat protein [Phycisphaerae bacterium]
MVRDSSIARPPSSGRLGAAIAAVLLISAGAAVYANSFSGVFLFDDEPAILKNPHIRSLTPLGDALIAPENTTVSGRPLVSLSLAINYALGGLNVWGYHALNLAVHLLAGLVLFGVVRRTLLSPRLDARYTGRATWLGLVIALLWVVHPLQTQAVTYVVQRAESMAGLFYLLTLYSVIRGAGGSAAPAWFGAAVVFCGLGMATKETPVTAPVVVLIYDRVFLARSFRELLRRRWLLYVALAATWCILAAVLWHSPRAASAGFGLEGLTPWAYARSQFGIILHYLWLAVWPLRQCLDYAWPPAHTAREFAPQMIVIVALLSLSGWALRRRPAWGFLGVWFFAILAPTSSVVPIADLAFEHRMYLPLAAFIAAFVLAADGALRAVAMRRPGAGGAAAWRLARVVLIAGVAVALGVLTLRRNREYHSAVAMWEDVIEKRPRNPRGYVNLGMALNELGSFDQAKTRFRQAVEIEPRYPKAHNELAVALCRTGEAAASFAHFRTAIKLAPNDAEAHNNFGVALCQSGRLNEGIEHLTRALHLNPRMADAHVNLGAAYEQIGRRAEAVVAYENVLRLRPDDADVRQRLNALRRAPSGE